MILSKMSSPIRSSCGRRPVRSLAAPAQAIYLLSLSGGRGSAEGEAGEDRGGPNEVGGIPGEAPGRATSQRRGVSRPRHPRCQVRFPPLRVSGIRVSDQGSDVAVDRRGAGGREIAEGREGKEGKEGKGAPPVGRELAGRELASFAKGRTTWRLTWCWSSPRPASTASSGRSSWSAMPCARRTPGKPTSMPSNNSFSGRRAARSRASRCKATSPGSGK